MTKVKKRTLLVCRFCHAVWEGSEYGEYVDCPSCLRMYYYDWSKGVPIRKATVRKMTPKEIDNYRESDISPYEPRGPVYTDGCINLNCDDLYDEFIHFYAGFQGWCDVPDVTEIDKFIYTGELTDEMHCFLEKLLEGKHKILKEMVENEEIMAEEKLYAASQFEVCDE